MSFRSRPTLCSLPARRQRGNTLLGIIIGLVIGLVIAVIVALVISKGSMPFTDKSGKVGKAAEPTAGQISDPNKPMYGSKEAAREAARDFSRDQNAATPAAPTATAHPAPAAPAAKPVDELQQVVDKIEAAAKPKPAATSTGATNVQPTIAAPAAAAGDDKFVYYLQAGAFREVADAENTRAKLALLGFEATVTDRTTDTGVLHRVRVGPYNQVETMNKVRSKLSENGIDVAVVRNQK